MLLLARQQQKAVPAVTRLEMLIDHTLDRLVEVEAREATRDGIDPAVLARIKENATILGAELDRALRNVFAIRDRRVEIAEEKAAPAHARQPLRGVTYRCPGCGLKLLRQVRR